MGSGIRAPASSTASQQTETVAAATTVMSDNPKWSCIHSVQGVMGALPDEETRQHDIPKSESVYSILKASVEEDEEDLIVYYPPIPGQNTSFINVPGRNFKVVPFGPLKFDLSDTTGQRVELSLAPDDADVLSGLTKVMVPPGDQKWVEDLSLVNVRVYEREGLEVSEKGDPMTTSVG